MRVHLRMTANSLPEDGYVDYRQDEHGQNNV